MDITYYGNNFQPSHITADDLFEKLFNKTQIRFVGSNLYRPYNGWEDLDDVTAANLFTVLYTPVPKGRQVEFIVEGDAEIIAQLQTLPAQFAWGLSMEEAVKFLEYKCISWEIVCPEEAAKL